MMNFITHIPWGRLVDRAEGRLPVEELAQLEAHIASCSRCAAQAVELERLIKLMRTDLDVDAPDTVIARAVDLYLRRQPSTPIAPRLSRPVPAILQFDSFGMAPAFGVRSGEPSARQLLYKTESHDIDLRIEPGDNGWVLSGQVLGEDSAGGHADLVGESNVIQTSLSEHSEFTFPPVTPGTYSLLLSLANLAIEVDELSIGS